MTVGVRTLDSPFFLRSLHSDGGELVVTVGHNDDHAVITFNFVRMFLVFKESDFWRELAKHEHQTLIRGDARSVGVFRILRRPLLAPLVGDRFDEEKPSYSWLSTPDHCIEIIAFESPKIVVLKPELEAN